MYFCKATHIHIYKREGETEDKEKCICFEHIVDVFLLRMRIKDNI